MNKLVWLVASSAFALLLLTGATGDLLPCDDGATVTPTVRWRAPPGPVGGYRLYRGEAAGVYGAPLEIAPPAASPGAVLSAPAAPANKAKVYYYALSARNSAGEGPKSNEVASVPSARVCPPLPSRPDLIEIRALLEQALEKIGALIRP
jgi:hypothetical protein